MTLRFVLSVALAFSLAGGAYADVDSAITNLSIQNSMGTGGGGLNLGGSGGNVGPVATPAATDTPAADAAAPVDADKMATELSIEKSQADAKKSACEKAEAEVKKLAKDGDAAAKEDAAKKMAEACKVDPMLVGTPTKTDPDEAAVGPVNTEAAQVELRKDDLKLDDPLAANRDVRIGGEPDNIDLSEVKDQARLIASEPDATHAPSVPYAADGNAPDQAINTDGLTSVDKTPTSLTAQAEAQATLATNSNALVTNEQGQRGWYALNNKTGKVEFVPIEYLAKGVPIGQNPANRGGGFGDFRAAAGNLGNHSHQGVDWMSPAGTPIYANVEGKVTAIGWGSGNVGNRVWITSADGSVRVMTAHMAGFNPELKVGDSVKLGDWIGYVGNSGATWSDPHLHFETRVTNGGSGLGTAYNPNVVMAQLYPDTSGIIAAAVSIPVPAYNGQVAANTGGGGSVSAPATTSGYNNSGSAGTNYGSVYPTYTYGSQGIDLSSLLAQLNSGLANTGSKGGGSSSGSSATTGSGTVSPSCTNVEIVEKVVNTKNADGSTTTTNTKTTTCKEVG